MSPGRRREIVDRKHSKLPIVRQCALLGVSRSSLYYRPKATSEEDLSRFRLLVAYGVSAPWDGAAAPVPKSNSCWVAWGYAAPTAAWSFSWPWPSQLLDIPASVS